MSLGGGVGEGGGHVRDSYHSAHPPRFVDPRRRAHGLESPQGPHDQQGRHASDDEAANRKPANYAVRTSLLPVLLSSPCVTQCGRHRLDCPLEYKKGESQTNIELKNPDDWQKYLELEEEYIRKLCEDIIALKPDLVITEKGVSGRVPQSARVSCF